MTIEQDLQRFISTEVVLDGAENGEVKVDEPLLSSGRVDSLGLLRILSYIEERYGVALLGRASPKTFDTVGGLAAAVRREAPPQEAVR